MAEERYPINIWVNEERFEKLKAAGLADLCEEMLAGMKVIRVYADEAQKDAILRLFPTAKFDSATTRSIEMMLTHANLNVYTTDLGEEGIDLAKLYDYDLILLDLGLPDMHGHEVLRQLRLARISTPILILSGTDDTESKLKGFGFGADDYLTKPFHRDELVARIHAIIRRSKGHSQSVIRTGKINVNLDAKTVDVAGRRCT